MRYAEDYSGYGNEVLYRMCAARPLHADFDTIQSKFALIGRYYGTSLERQVRSTVTTKEVVEAIRQSHLDGQIERLKTVDRPTQDNLDILLDAHQYLTNLLESVTGVRKSSLASKYLHFHAPRSVFIFDSKAAQMIRKFLPKGHKTFPCAGLHDPKYEAFTRRCIHYRNYILEPKLGALATPRMIDMMILGYSAEQQRVNCFDP